MKDQGHIMKSIHAQIAAMIFVIGVSYGSVEAFATYDQVLNMIHRSLALMILKSSPAPSHTWMISSLVASGLRRRTFSTTKRVRMVSFCGRQSNISNFVHVKADTFFDQIEEAEGEI